LSETYYAWKEGSRFKVNPAVAAYELSQCADDSGRIMAQLVVNRARSTLNPIHDEFEWDDSIAAEEHRKYTARIMAASLITVINRVDKPPIAVEAVVHRPQRALVHLTKGYRWIDEVKSDVLEYTMLLESARRDAQIFMNKYRSLKEVKTIITAIELAIASNSISGGVFESGFDMSG